MIALAGPDWVISPPEVTFREAAVTVARLVVTAFVRLTFEPVRLSGPVKLFCPWVRSMFPAAVSVKVPLTSRAWLPLVMSPLVVMLTGPVFAVS